MEPCPYCNSPIDEDKSSPPAIRHYFCDTVFINGKKFGERGERCYEDQIAQLTERLEAWRGLNQIKNYIALPFSHPIIKRLRELKELE